MKKILASVLALCFLTSIGFAAEKSTVLVSPTMDKTEIKKPIIPASSPTKSSTEETKPDKTLLPGNMKPSLLPGTLKAPSRGRDAGQALPAIKSPVTSIPTRKSPGSLLPGRKSPTPQAGLNTMIKPMTATIVPTAPDAPILESITFHGHDPSGNLIWQVLVNNNNPTEYTELLKVNAMQERDGPGGLNSWSAGAVMVTPQPLAAGQRTQVGGSFTRDALSTRLKLRLKNDIGPGIIFHEIQAPLPPDLAYQAQIASISMDSVINKLQVRVQNIGPNAIPELSVQKFCAHSSTPNNFSACGGSSKTNILPSQTVDFYQTPPLGWPSDPNIIKVVVRRGLIDYDEQLFYAPSGGLAPSGGS